MEQKFTLHTNSRDKGMGVSLAIFAVVASYIAIAILRWSLKRHKRHNLFKRYGIPGPKTSFISGNMHQLKNGPTSNDVITSWLKQYGDIFGYFMGGIPFLVIKDLDMLKQIFIKDSDVFTNRPDMFLDIRPFNKSVVHLRDQRWKEVRSFLSPTLSSGKIKLMTDIVAKKVDITLDIVGKHAQKGEMFDFYELVQGLSLDVIAACALAMNTHCQESSKDIFLVSVRDFFRNAHNHAVDYAIMFPFVETIMSFFFKNMMMPGKMTKLILDSINKAISARRKDLDVRSVDILQFMLEHSDAKIDSGLTDEEIIANAYIFLLAGYETTATALAFTFYLLAKHPEIQDKLYQEIAKVRDSSYSSVQNLQYLSQVVNESLRYYPPATGFISRQCQRDHQVGSLTIPEGVIVLAPVWDIHHDPELWPDPWKFDPDRFSLENKASIDSMAFIPFGNGMRKCIGARFAQLEIKLAMFRLLKKFRFEICEKTDNPLTLMCPNVNIIPAKGVYLRAVARTPEA